LAGSGQTARGVDPVVGAVVEDGVLEEGGRAAPVLLSDAELPDEEHAGMSETSMTVSAIRVTLAVLMILPQRSVIFLPLGMTKPS